MYCAKVKTRIHKVIRLLRSEQADALLVWNSEGSGQPATRWLSGFLGTASVALILLPPPRLRHPSLERRGGRHHLSCFLITDGRYTAQAKKEAKGFTVLISSAKKPTLKILAEIIAENKVGRILFDGSVTAYGVVEEVKQILEKTTPVAESPLTKGALRRDVGGGLSQPPKAAPFGKGKTTPGLADSATPFSKGDTPLSSIELISRKHILQELRVVKEKEEIQLLKESAEIACRAFARLIPELHVGMSEKEIAKRLEDLMTEEGAEGIAFPTIVASGKNGALPHARPTDKKIKSGELVTIDFGARYKGYVSDMTRTLAVGKISSRLRKMYEAVRVAQELGCQKAKAGMTGAEIDAVCREYLTKKGYGKYFTHSTGHGIGMEVHELPHVSPNPTPSNSPLERGRGRENALPAGAVITCEPGVYIPNVGGVRIEDALVLTKRGNVNLTEGVTKELIVV
ncbi:MAG: Peptidase M24 [Parcubacteria group bacterium GW2011_GWA2_49_9]|nr:MAG: Peptidase M24 [Parcubacteria group bacterium GW2011_GWA2_49_9]